MNRIDQAELVKLVRDRGLVDDARAWHAIVATLEALGAQVPQPERRAFEHALPEPFARALAARQFHGPGEVDAVEAAVAKAAHENRGFAREHVEIVCAALGELLPPDVATRVTRAVAPSIADKFHAPSRDDAEPPPHSVTHGEGHHTLATGAPGSRHPIASSRPADAQTEAVGAENPHGDTKLSSAHGETQEREDEALANARPRTARTIAQSRD